MARTSAAPRGGARAVPPKKGLQRVFGFVNLSSGFDMYFFVLLMIILIIGLATLYSASHVYAFNYDDGDSYFYIRKQLLWAALGMAGMLVVSMVDYHVLHRWAVPIYGGSMILLVVALFLPSESGIHRWIRIPGLGQFQPRSWLSLR